MCVCVRSQGVSKTFGALVYKAHRSVIIAIARLSCTVSAVAGSVVGARGASSTKLLTGVGRLEFRRRRVGAAVVRDAPVLRVVRRRGPQSSHRRIRPTHAART